MRGIKSYVFSWRMPYLVVHSLWVSYISLELSIPIQNVLVHQYWPCCTAPYTPFYYNYILTFRVCCHPISPWPWKANPVLVTSRSSIGQISVDGYSLCWGVRRILWLWLMLRWYISTPPPSLPPQWIISFSVVLGTSINGRYPLSILLVYNSGRWGLLWGFTDEGLYMGRKKHWLICLSTVKILFPVVRMQDLLHPSWLCQTLIWKYSSFFGGSPSWIDVLMIVWWVFYLSCY